MVRAGADRSFQRVSVRNESADRGADAVPLAHLDVPSILMTDGDGVNAAG
jgi:hypothetical protein